MAKGVKFYVITYNINSREMEPYDVIPYLLDCYKRAKVKPKTRSDFKKFIEKESMYQWWSRCEYEIILQSWPCQDHEEKWDVHKQVLMNIEVITDLIMSKVIKS